MLAFIEAHLQCVDRDAVPRPLLRECSGYTQQSSVGSGVSCRVGDPPLGEDGDDVDDASVAGRLHGLRGGTADEAWRDEVGYKQVVPLGEVPVLHRRRGDDICGVDQDIQSSELFDDFGDRSVDLARHGCVELERKVATSERPNLVRHRLHAHHFGRPTAQAGDGDIGAGFGEGDSGGAAKRIAGAHDHGSAALERKRIIRLFGIGRRHKVRHGVGFQLGSESGTLGAQPVGPMAARPPPSWAIVSPLMPADASAERKTASGPISHATPARPTGM